MCEFVVLISDGLRLSTFVLEANDMHPLIEMIQRSQIRLEVMVFGIDGPLYLLALLYLEVPGFKVVVHYQHLVRKYYLFSGRSPHFRLLFHFLKSCVGAVLRLLHYLSVHICLLIRFFIICRIIIRCIIFLWTSNNLDGSTF